MNTFKRLGALIRNCGGVGGTPGPCKTVWEEAVSTAKAGDTEVQGMAKPFKVSNKFDKKNLARIKKEVNAQLDMKSDAELAKMTAEELIGEMEKMPGGGAELIQGELVWDYSDLSVPPVVKNGPLIFRGYSPFHKALYKEYGVEDPKEYIAKFTKTVNGETLVHPMDRNMDMAAGGHPYLKKTTNLWLKKTGQYDAIYGKKGKKK